MFFFILIAALFEIISLSNPGEGYDNIGSGFYKVQLMIQIIFTFDLVVHFIAMFAHYHKFLFYKWNMFDSSIVVALWLPFIIDIVDESIRLLRGTLY